jgi:hypothetical protein
MAAADKYWRAERWRWSGLWATMGRHSRLGPVCAGETRGCSGHGGGSSVVTVAPPPPPRTGDRRTRHGRGGVRRRLAMAHGNQPPPTAARNPPPQIERRRHGMIASTMPTRLQAVRIKSLAGANITASMFSYNPLLMFACIPNLPSPFHYV